MIEKYETIIWDWNGTLINDIQVCVEIANFILSNHNDRRLDIESYREVFGFPITDYYLKIGIDFQKETFAELTNKFISRYESDVMQCELHDKVTDIISGFEENGLHQYILTAAHKESVRSLLGHFSIENYFKEVEGLDNHRAESKVQRGIELLNNNGIDKKETILIGDTLHDYEVAREIGVDCILIANGHQSKRRLMDKVADGALVIDEIGQLSV